MQQVRSLGPLASFTTVLLCVMAIIGALGVAVALRRAGMFEQFLDAKFDGSYADLEDKFDDSDVQLGGVWLAFLVAWLVTVVAFISWQYRHARNAEALGGDGLGAGWAVGGWFIPVANLVLPGVQLFGASKAATRRSPEDEGRGSPLVPLWMAAFSLAYLTSFMQIVHPQDSDLFPTDVPLPRKEVIEKALLVNRVVAASYALYVVAAVVGVLMVQSLSKRQTRRAREIEQSGPPVAASWGAQPRGWPGQPPTGWSPAPAPPAPWGPAPSPTGGVGQAPGQAPVPPPPPAGPQLGGQEPQVHGHQHAPPPPGAPEPFDG